MNARNTINSGIEAKILHRFLTANMLVDVSGTLSRLLAIIVPCAFCLYCIRRCFIMIVCTLGI